MAQDAFHLPCQRGIIRVADLFSKRFRLRLRMTQSYAFRTIPFRFTDDVLECALLGYERRTQLPNLRSWAGMRRSLVALTKGEAETGGGDEARGPLVSVSRGGVGHGERKPAATRRPVRQ